MQENPVVPVISREAFLKNPGPIGLEVVAFQAVRGNGVVHGRGSGFKDLHDPTSGSNPIEPDSC